MCKMGTILVTGNRAWHLRHSLLAHLITFNGPLSAVQMLPAWGLKPRARTDSDFLPVGTAPALGGSAPVWRGLEGGRRVEVRRPSGAGRKGEAEALGVEGRDRGAGRAQGRAGLGAGPGRGLEGAWPGGGVASAHPPAGRARGAGASKAGRRAGSPGRLRGPRAGGGVRTPGGAAERVPAPSGEGQAGSARPQLCPLHPAW